MRKFLTFIGLLCLCFLGCKEDFDIFIPDDPTTPIPGPISGSISNFFDTVFDEGHSFTINAEEFTTLRSPDNNYFEIPANSFIDNSGNVVAGEIKVDIIEISSKGDMILHNVPTESDGRLIESMGAFHIQATKDDEPLQLSDNVSISIHIPIQGEWNDEMELFYGERLNDGSFNWIEADGNPDQQGNVWTGEVFDTLTQSWGLTYYLQSNQLNWINCDDFVETQELGTIHLKLPESYSDTNTVAFIVFEDMNAIMGMNWSTEVGQFVENYVPMNSDVQILVIADGGDDQFYFSNFKTIFHSDSTIELSPEKAPLGDIVELISGL